MVPIFDSWIESKILHGYFHFNLIRGSDLVDIHTGEGLIQIQIHQSDWDNHIEQEIINRYGSQVINQNRVSPIQEIFSFSAEDSKGRIQMYEGFLYEF